MTMNETITKLPKEWVKIPIHVTCENGRKKLTYPQNWTQLDTFDPCDTCNGLAVKTGKDSGIVVIDIDNEAALNELQDKFSVNLFNEAKFIVKTKKGWHFYFNYTPNLRTTTSYAGIKGVDIRSDGGNVIIYTDTNAADCASYAIIKDEFPLSDVPQRLIYVNKQSGFIKEVVEVRERSGTPLAVLIDDLLGVRFINGKLRGLTDRAKSALRRLTPVVFRTGEMGEHYRTIFERHGYIAPNDIYDGDGSTYLSRVAAIIAADDSVDYNTYETTLKHLNTLWQEPMSDERLEKTIIKKGHIVIDGKDIWQYDRDWREKYERRQVSSKLEDIGYLAAYNPQLDSYVLYDLDNLTPYVLSKQGFTQMILSLTGEKFKEWDTLPIIGYTFNPTKEERFVVEDKIKKINLFKRSPLLELALQREKPIKEPKYILKIIENLFPDIELMELFLDWLGYWWLTLEKTKTAWVITSPQGAGKGILTDLIIANVVGKTYCSLEVGSELIESQFNAWLENKLFVSFNEINTLTQDRYKNRNKLKMILTGDTFQLRKMQQNPIEYPNFANFIFSTNDFVPLDIEESDRRYNVTQGSKPLMQFDWFRAIVDNLEEVILEELPDFVRYVTSRDTLSKQRYNQVIETELKRDMMLDNLTSVEEFIVALRDKDLEWFDIALSGTPIHDAKLEDLKTYFKEGYIATDEVMQLVDILGVHYASKTKLTRLAKKYGFETGYRKPHNVTKRVWIWTE